MQYESITTHSQRYSVSITNSQAEALLKSSQEQATVRVYEHGRIGVAGQMGEYDIAQLLKRAEDRLSMNIPYPCMLESRVSQRDAFKEIIKPERFLPAVKNLLARLKQSCPHFIFSNKIDLRESWKHYSNSRGSSLDYRGSSLNLSIVIKDKASSNIMDGAYNCVTDSYDEDKAASDIINFTSAYLRRLELPGAELPVILDLSLLGMLIKDFKGEQYAAGSGILSGKLNERLFNKKLDVLLEREKPNTCFFDAEGTVKEENKFYLVKQGVISGMLTTKRTAEEYALPLSGSAAAAFDGVPYAGCGGLTLGAGASNIEEVLKGRAIYAAMSSGGDMLRNGDVGMPVQLAFLYEDGRLLGRLPELMLGGNIFRLLNEDFIGCAQEGPFNYSEEPLMACNMRVRALE